LQANPPAGQAVTSDSMQAVRIIIEQRINGLGVTEPLIQPVGFDRIAVQLPGVRDPDLAIKTFGETGLLEFIELGDQFLPAGTVVSTTGFITGSLPLTDTATITGTTQPATSVPTIKPTLPPTPTLGPTLTPAATITATASVTPSEQITPTEAVTTTVLGPFKTIMTGNQLQSANVAFDPQTGSPLIAFSLTSDGARIFADYTAKNIGRFLCITIDKSTISCPRIQGAIPSGNGQITGQFTREEAQALVVQLKYGALPVPLKVISSRTVGPTLGQDSINRSLTAGLIGISMVIVFMLLYYRLPGLLADIALLLYGTLVFSLFKLIPVTLTLAGIAGFVLSIGLAVDANILIFERMKEELRAGRSLKAAIRAGFDRAWPSIRDSNASTLITCAILFWFGSNFGASIVAGFALTLAIGVLVSLFTAIAVTRNLLTLVMDMDITKNHWWFGV
ncbi:MAG: protein translocase subunit SecD, partial [Chloroflexi bacterium]|nr:protein translocase subunit SecD [Chloroflexota bacterium]